MECTPCASFGGTMETVPIAQSPFCYHSPPIATLHVLHLSKIKVTAKLFCWTSLKQSKR